jgi:hypothetical protein
MRIGSRALALAVPKLNGATSSRPRMNCAQQPSTNMRRRLDAAAKKAALD